MVYKLNEDMLDPLVCSKQDFHSKNDDQYFYKQNSQPGVLADRGVGKCGSIEVSYICLLFSYSNNRLVRWLVREVFTLF